MAGRMIGLGFYVLFNSISVIPGQREDDNERLCEMEPCYGWKISSLSGAQTWGHLIGRQVVTL